MSISACKHPDQHYGTDKAGFAECSKDAETLALSPASLGQLYPHRCPQPANAPLTAQTAPLGEPMTIADVASLLGCSPWTVRQRYLRQGLPHLRASARGRLVFFRSQVIAWILKRQQKGGKH